MGRNKKSKNREGVVYSTNPDFEFRYSGDKEQETLPPSQQDLRVMLDKRQRGGKQVTLVTGFVGTDQDLKDLGKLLKSKCGTGGGVKDGEIMVQGNNVEKVRDILTKDGYRVKISGGY
jgi:translation initiation factor 1